MEDCLIDLKDKDLVNWVKKALEDITVGDVTVGDVTVSLREPHKPARGQEISLYLLSLAEYPPMQGTQRAPLQFWLRYLVTAWAEDPSRAHELLGKLLLAALDTPEYEVELENIPPTIWTGYGIPPRPAFILRVPVRKERAQRSAQLVREPLHVNWIKSAQLNGSVYGPQDTPLPGVRIALVPDTGTNILALEYARLCPSTVTDSHGLFTFAPIPAQPRYNLFIQIKDQELFIGIDRPAPENTPLILRWGLLTLQASDRDGQPVAAGLVRFSREGSTTHEFGLVCETGREPLRGLRLVYPTLQLAALLNTQGEGYLLLHEKALVQAGQWLPDLRGQLLTADQQPLAGAQIVCLALNLSTLTDDQGAFKFK